MNPYLVITDSKGLYAFQPLTRERWTRGQSIVVMHANMEMFKIKLSYEEANIIRFLISNHLYRFAAYNVTRIRLKRGDFVE